MNAIQEQVFLLMQKVACHYLLTNADRVVKRNLSSALIIEDDVDWDIRIRSQLQDFATAAYALAQPLAGTSDTYADPTYPAPNSNSLDAVPTVLDFHHLPPVSLPEESPYGDRWDLMWLGHCGAHFPTADNGANLPRARVVWEDETVPQRQHLFSFWQPDCLKDEYPDHTRVVHHAQVCFLDYGFSRAILENIYPCDQGFDATQPGAWAGGLLE